MAKEKLENTTVETKVNPFDEGVSYKAFLKALGENEISEYLEDICTEDQIEFVKKELKLI